MSDDQELVERMMRMSAMNSPDSVGQSSAPRDKSRANLQLLSVVWVIAFIGFRMWQMAGGNAGPSGFVERALVTTPSGVLALWVGGLIVPMAIWFACRKAPPTQDDKVLNSAVGVIAFGFLALHLSHSAWPRILGYLDALGAYQRMLRELGTPVFIASYALGLPALAFVVHRLVTSLFEEESRGDVFAIVVAIAVLGFGLYAVSGMMTGAPLIRL